MQKGIIREFEGVKYIGTDKRFIGQTAMVRVFKDVDFVVAKVGDHDWQGFERTDFEAIEDGDAAEEAVDPSAGAGSSPAPEALEAAEGGGSEGGGPAIETWKGAGGSSPQVDPRDQLSRLNDEQPGLAINPPAPSPGPSVSRGSPYATDWDRIRQGKYPEPPRPRMYEAEGNIPLPRPDLVQDLTTAISRVDARLKHAVSVATELRDLARVFAWGGMLTAACLLLILIVSFFR